MKLLIFYQEILKTRLPTRFIVHRESSDSVVAEHFLKGRFRVQKKNQKSLIKKNMRTEVWRMTTEGCTGLETWLDLMNNVDGSVTVRCCHDASCLKPD